MQQRDSESGNLKSSERGALPISELIAPASNQVLAGIRVIDCGRFVAGPCCAAILGDLGAEVIRVEKPGGAEDRWMTPLTDSGEGAMYLQNNRNKRSLTLDLATDAGQGVLQRLVKSADVVVANLPQQVLVAMRLDYPSLIAIKPDIILTTASAYGNGGPYSNRVGFDGVGQVMSGAVYRSGTPDQPVRATVPYVDYGTAMSCAAGTLAALLNRFRTGHGQLVEGTLLTTALMITSAMLMEQEVLKLDRVATLNRGQLAAPSDIFRAKDGWLLVQAVGDPMFKRWARLMGEEHWLTDPRYKTDGNRGENHAAIGERMQRWCMERTKAQCLSELEDARISAFSVNSPQEALDDPHVKAMGILRPTDYPGLPSPAPIVETPFRLSKTPPTFRVRPPTIGEHTDEILVEFGYSRLDIAELRRQGVV